MTGAMDDQDDRPVPRRTSKPPADADGPGFLTMIGFVAVLVAAVVLVFFGIGYVIGRVFL